VALKALRYETSTSLPQWRDDHFSLKSGPNKGPAIFGAISDLSSIFETLFRSLKVLGGQAFTLKVDTLMGALPIFASLPLALHTCGEGKGVIRRLEGIPDMEGKTRVIAILDYWSQNVLRSLHDHLFGILRKIPQDLTHSQHTVVDVVGSWGRVELYSIDLSSATDRFPIDLIADVLGGRFPSDYVAS
jgi:hypothetical protein